jgi:hypothetical protein
MIGASTAFSGIRADVEDAVRAGGLRAFAAAISIALDGGRA